MESAYEDVVRNKLDIAQLKREMQLIRERTDLMFGRENWPYIIRLRSKDTGELEEWKFISNGFNEAKERAVRVFGKDWDIESVTMVN